MPFTRLRHLASALLLLLALAAHTDDARACAAAADRCCDVPGEGLSQDDTRAVDHTVNEKRTSDACASGSHAAASCEAHDDATRACNCGDECGDECDECCFDASLRSMTSPVEHAADVPFFRLLVSPAPVPLENTWPTPKLPPRA